MADSKAPDADDFASLIAGDGEGGALARDRTSYHWDVFPFFLEAMCEFDVFR